MKILIVEDDRLFNQLLKETVEDHGYEVVCAHSLEQAIQTSLDDVTALIVDVMLPNDPQQSGISADETRSGYISGVALLRKLRKTNKTPAILISATQPSQEVAEWAENEGVPIVSKLDGASGITAALQKLSLPIKQQKAASFIERRKKATISETDSGEALTRDTKGQRPEWISKLLWFVNHPWWLTGILAAALLTCLLVRLAGRDPFCPLLIRMGYDCKIEATVTNIVTVTNVIPVSDWTIDTKTAECIAYAKANQKPYWIESITEVVHLQFDQTNRTRVGTFQVVYVLRLLRDIRRNDRSFTEWFNTSDQRARFVRISGSDEESVHGANGKFDVEIEGKAGDIRTVVTGGRFIWPYEAEPRNSLGNKLRLGRSDDTWNYPNDVNDAIREFTMIIYSEGEEIRPVGQAAKWLKDGKLATVPHRFNRPDEGPAIPSISARWENVFGGQEVAIHFQWPELKAKE